VVILAVLVRAGFELRLARPHLRRGRPSPM